MNNIEDIKNWKTGLPITSVWNTGGFDLSWHVGNVKDGNRLIPSIKLPSTLKLEVEKLLLSLDANAEFLKYISDNNLPLILRDSGQIAQRMTERDRGQLPESAVQWRIKPDGTLDSTPVADPFGPVSLWFQEGETIANSAWMKKLQELCPNPLWVGYWDNNEIGYANPKMYVNPKTKTWKTYDELTGVSLRLRDYVYNEDKTLKVDSNPYIFWPEFYSRRKEHFQAFYSGITSNLTSWSGKQLIPVAYSAGAAFDSLPSEIIDQIGYAPEAVCYDGTGPSYYPGAYLPKDLMNEENVIKAKNNMAAWDQNKAKNPNAFRTVFLSMVQKAAIAPAYENGQEVSSPKIFQAYSEWVAWLVRKPGEPVLLQHWIGNATKPSDLFFDEERQMDLEALGRVDLASVTHGEYAQAVIEASDRISSEIIRDFWLKGESIPQESVSEDYRLVLTKLGDKALVYAWSSKALTGKITVTVPGFGDFEINAPSMGGKYILIAPPPPSNFIITELT